MILYVHIWQFIIVALAGWLNRHQQAVLEYLQEENRILKEKLGHKVSRTAASFAVVK